MSTSVVMYSECSGSSLINNGLLNKTKRDPLNIYLLIHFHEQCNIFYSTLLENPKQTTTKKTAGLQFGKGLKF